MSGGSQAGCEDLMSGSSLRTASSQIGGFSCRSISPRRTVFHELQLGSRMSPPRCTPLHGRAQGPVQHEGVPELRAHSRKHHWRWNWQEGSYDGAPAVIVEVGAGERKSGYILPVLNQVVQVDPKRLHKTMPWSGGPKWTIFAHTVDQRK